MWGALSPQLGANPSASCTWYLLYVGLRSWYPCASLSSQPINFTWKKPGACLSQAAELASEASPRVFCIVVPLWKPDVAGREGEVSPEVFSVIPTCGSCCLRVGGVSLLTAVPVIRRSLNLEVSSPWEPQQLSQYSQYPSNTCKLVGTLGACCRVLLRVHPLPQPSLYLL